AGQRLTERGVWVGTPEYMSPEQALGEESLDARSDVYSLGCVLYELLVGEPPYTGPTAQAVIAKRLAGPAPGVRRLRATVPGGVEKRSSKRSRRSQPTGSFPRPRSRRRSPSLERSVPRPGPSPCCRSRT